MNVLSQALLMYKPADAPDYLPITIQNNTRLFTGTVTGTVLSTTIQNNTRLFSGTATGTSLSVTLSR